MVKSLLIRIQNTEQQLSLAFLFYKIAPKTTKMIKIIIADDHKIVREGLKALLSSAGEIEIIEEAPNGLILLHQLKTIQPDLVLLDIGMPVMDGIEAASKIKTEFPKVKILVLTTYVEQSKIKKMLKIGVHGYVLKDSGKDALINAIRTVTAGQNYYDQRVTDVVMSSYQPKKVTSSGTIALTKREKEIAELIAKGKSTKEVSQELFISPLTVDTHRKNIFSKLGINKVTALVKYALKEGWID
jgi:DNA-binding NarL/FixJ family response regulator